jgi:hypothetical protein
MSTLRARVRLAHVGIAAFTIGIVYSPSFDATTVRDLLRLAVLPALAVTGAALWALPALRRRAASRRLGAPAVAGRPRRRAGG